MNWLRPSFPKAIAVVAAVCTFLMLEYRSPQLNPRTRAKRATRKNTLKVVRYTPPPVYCSFAGFSDELWLATAEKMPGLFARKRTLAFSAKKRKAVLASLEKMKRLKRIAKRRRARRNLPAFYWELPADHSQAVDLTAPLDSIVHAAFEEPSLLGEWQLLPGQSVREVSLPREPSLQMIVSQIVPSSFSNIKTSLVDQRQALKELGTLAAAEQKKLEPTLVRPEPRPPKEPELVRPAVKVSATLTSPVAASVPERKPAVLSKIEEREQTQEKKEEDPPEAAPSVSVAAETNEPALVAPPISELNAMYASLGGSAPVRPTRVASQTAVPSVATQASDASPSVNHAVAIPEAAVTPDQKNVLVIPSQKREPPAQNRLAVKPSIPDPAKPDVDPVHDRTGDRGLEQKIFGRMELDAYVSDWLDKKKGYFELALVKEGSSDSQDRIPVDYEFPNEEFTILPTGLKGSYRLVASFFVPESLDPVARVAHRENITADNHTRNIHFRVTTQAMARAFRRVSKSPSSGVLFTANLYKVDPGSHRRLKPKKKEPQVPGAKMSIMAFPQWGVSESQGDDTLRMQLPAHSELLAKIEAPGFYPTYRIIPTFGANVHSHIYLANEKELEPIVRYFTKKKKIDNTGLVFGRIFNPVSRDPMGLVPVEISYPLTADQLLPSTTETGFFGFSNVVSSMRAVLRPNGGRTTLVNVPEGSAEYLELGRGGKETLVGRLTNPFGDAIPPSKVKIPGDPESETWTDENGVFRMEDLDFPPGVVTIEVEAEGYPVTWHNIAWNVQRKKRPQALPMLKEEMIRAAAAANEDLRAIEKRTGILVGAIEQNFFRRENCLSIALTDISGREVSIEKGPYAFSGTSNRRSLPYCASSASPGFAYYNLAPGEYILKITNSKNRLIRAHVVRVGQDRVTLTVN